MTPREEGFLLLCSHLGFSARPALTGPQLRVLTQRVRQAGREDPDRDLKEQDLTAMGYSPPEARRILGLLEDKGLLRQYIRSARRAGCEPVTLVSPQYPALLKQRLGPDSPGCLWAKGDLSLLNRPAIAVVGSREPGPEAREFAVRAGQMAARQGYVLVSGNARGVDSAAQESCLEAGGSVISVVADELSAKTTRERVLYLSEDGFELPFSAARALSRNRVIHCLGRKTLVSQCRLGRGGTWNGTERNLKKGWSPVFCFDDGTPAVRELRDRGARLIGTQDLRDLTSLEPEQETLFKVHENSG